MRANLTRCTHSEPFRDAWCDSIRVLIRVLPDGDLNRLAATAYCHRMASPARDGAVQATIRILGQRELDSDCRSA